LQIDVVSSCYVAIHYSLAGNGERSVAIDGNTEKGIHNIIVILQ
jgi:hypothetical protein